MLEIETPQLQAHIEQFDVELEELEELEVLFVVFIGGMGMTTK